MMKKARVAEAILACLGEKERELPGAWDAHHASELAAFEAFRLMDLRRRDAIDAATEALRLYGLALRLALAE